MTNSFDDHAERSAQARRAWTAPAVHRLSAGSAEDGAGPTPDAGAFPS